VTEASPVVRALRAPAVAVPEVLRASGLLPAAPGFYAWWSRQGEIGLPHIPHPLDEEISLLYVGISPAREASRQTVRSRVIGNHLNGNVGSSTFRFALAALLTDALDLRPYLRGTKVALSASDNRPLGLAAEAPPADLVCKRATVGDRKRSDRAAHATAQLLRQRHACLLPRGARGAG
jgi:GIY-YIG catalytic domain